MSGTYETATRSMNGPEKVAALLLVMGKPLASRLLGHFEPTELKAITRSAAELGAVPIGVLEGLVEEIAGEFSNNLELRGTVDEAENLIAGVLPPEQVKDIMSDVLGSSNSTTWEKIEALPNDVLTAYLVQQHPQVLTLALSKLNSGKAAGILELLARPLRNAVTRRLLALGPVADAALRVIEARIKPRSDRKSAGAGRSRDGPHGRHHQQDGPRSGGRRHEGARSRSPRARRGVASQAVLVR